MIKGLKMQSRLYRFVLVITCLLIATVLLRQWCVDIGNFPFLFPHVNIYESYGISDWLINYQGGFVRRGLAGELLFQIYQYHPYSVVYAIIIIDIVCLILLGIVLVWLFRRMGMPIWLLIFPMFLYYPLNGLSGLLYGRRDSLMLLLTFILFFQFRRFLVSRSSVNLLTIWGLTVFILLFYEGIFFSFFPFLFLYTMMFNHTSFYRRICMSLWLWWPVATVLLLIVGCHGDDNLSFAIWNSWNPCFSTYPLDTMIPPMGKGVEWLQMSLLDAIKLHFSVSWLSGFVADIPVWPFNLYVIIAVYFLMTRSAHMTNAISSCQIDCVQLSNVLILQLLFVLPMLGWIADDWYRSVPYSCITSCFLCYLFPERKNMPIALDRFSERIQQKIDKSVWLRNPWLYYFILVSLPLCQQNARPGGMFPFIPNDLKHRLMEMVLG